MKAASFVTVMTINVTFMVAVTQTEGHYHAAVYSFYHPFILSVPSLIY